MDDLISRKYLYDEIAKLEDDARTRVMHTPKGSPEYLVYKCQLDERSALKHEIMDAPTVEAKEVVHGEWIKTFKYVAKNINTKKVEAMFNYSCPMCGYTTANQGRHFNFCPNCGCDMRGSAK